MGCLVKSWSSVIAFTFSMMVTEIVAGWSMVQRPSLPMDGTWERVQLHLAYPRLLKFDHAIVGKGSGPCLAISFYLDGHMT